MQLTQAERDANALDAETLRLAVQEVRVNGYVVFEGVLPEGRREEQRSDSTRFIHLCTSPCSPFCVTVYSVRLVMVSRFSENEDRLLSSMVTGTSVYSENGIREDGITWEC